MKFTMVTMLQLSFIFTRPQNACTDICWQCGSKSLLARHLLDDEVITVQFDERNEGVDCGVLTFTFLARQSVAAGKCLCIQAAKAILSSAKEKSVRDILFIKIIISFQLIIDGILVSFCPRDCSSS